MKTCATGITIFIKTIPIFRSSTRAQIRNTKFSDVLKRNTTLTNLQANVFFTEECPGDEEEEGAAVDSLPTTEKTVTTDPKIFPNPASNTIHVDFGSMTGDVNIQIFNIGGNKLLKTQNAVAGSSGTDINIGDISPGMYIVIITSATEKKTIKLVKSGR